MSIKLNLMGLDSEKIPPSELVQIKKEWPAYILLTRAKWNKTKIYIMVILDLAPILFFWLKILFFIKLTHAQIKTLKREGNSPTPKSSPDFKGQSTVSCAIP